MFIKKNGDLTINQMGLSKHLGISLTKHSMVILFCISFMDVHGIANNLSDCPIVGHNPKMQLVPGVCRETT